MNGFDKWLLVVVLVSVLAPGCNCSHPDLTACSGTNCVGPKEDHEVVCNCGIDTPIGDAVLDLRVCLPADLNNATGSAAEVAAIDALSDTDYAAAVAAYCESRVAPSLHDIVGHLNEQACGLATVTCALAATDEGVSTRPNEACDLPCANVTCDVDNCNPDLVAPDVEDIHAELCKCTNIDGCSEATGEPMCLTPTWAPDPPSIFTGALARLTSLPSDATVDSSSSNIALMITADPGFPCASDTQTANLSPKGTMSLYGRPCTGESCNYLMEFEVTAAPFSMTFDNGIVCGSNSIQITQARVTGGTDGTFVTLDSFGVGTIPAGGLVISADAIVGGNERFTFFSTTTEPIALAVDFAAKTFQMPSATLNFAEGSVTASLVGTITDQPPQAYITPEDPTLECTSPGGAEVLLDGSASSDPDSDISFLSWWDGKVFDDAALLGTGASVTVLAPLGTTSYALSVTDHRLATHANRSAVTVADTTAPTLDLGVSLEQLWPPNHKLVPITVDVQVMDACDSSATFVLTSITSDEPDNGLGDGDTANDIQGADFGTPDTEFFLRAERQGGQDGRTYTIVYTATDASFNTTESVVTVEVAHDQGP
jgi:hypothetical protein